MNLQAPFQLLFITFIISLLIILRKWRSSNTHAKLTQLPPGPKRLPIIGNLHQMAGALPHHWLANLAKKHGPLMHVRLGEMALVVISSPDMAKEFLKEHELSFAQRPKITAHEVMLYENSSFVFSPYGEYWRQMRKIIVLELLSRKRVMSFQSIRDRETRSMIKSISSSSLGGRPVNLSKLIPSLINDVTSMATFGERCKYKEEFLSFLKEVIEHGGGLELPDLFPSIRILRYFWRKKQTWVRLHHKVDTILGHIIDDHKAKLSNNEQTSSRDDLVDVLLKMQRTSDLTFLITTDVIKNVIMELFSAGTDTSSTTVEWAMSEMMKNPRVMAKAQSEVRTILNGKTRIQESDIQRLDYLKNIVKETLRLHPPGPLLVREAREECMIKGYRIPQNAKVIVNLSVLGKDPEYWSDPESFMPERFEESGLDFMGGSLKYIPFGSGRRICPGINFGLANMELTLSQLLYHFDWEVAEELDMNESFGITSRRKNDLVLIPTTVVPVSNKESDSGASSAK